MADDISASGLPEERKGAKRGRGKPRAAERRSGRAAADAFVGGRLDTPPTVEEDLLERSHWAAVERITREIFPADAGRVAALRSDILAMPWVERRLLYNAEPVDLAAEVAGVTPTISERERGRQCAESAAITVAAEAAREAELDVDPGITPARDQRKTPAAPGSGGHPKQSPSAEGAALGVAAGLRPSNSPGDPLGDMLTRIRKGQRARMSTVASPASKLQSNVLEVLKREGYIRGYSQEEVRPGINQLKIELKYNDGEPVIKQISRVKKPGLRVYSKIADLPKVYNGLGIAILSTPKGVMSQAEAQEAGVDGDIVCVVTPNLNPAPSR